MSSDSSGVVLVGEDIAPTAFLEADWRAGGAIALTRGSTTSHVAMLARARGIPMIVGLGELPSSLVTLAVDGGSGMVLADPDAAQRRAVAARERLTSDFDWRTVATRTAQVYLAAKRREREPHPRRTIVEHPLLER
jgi:glycogen(starch) synthase